MDTMVTPQTQRVDSRALAEREVVEAALNYAKVTRTAGLFTDGEAHVQAAHTRLLIAANALEYLTDRAGQPEPPAPLV